MTAPDGRTYHDPAAEAAARAFETAVADYGRAAHDAKDRGFDDPAVVDAAIAVFIAHRAAVADADAAGYARAMGEVDEACVSLYDYDGGGRRVMIGKTSFDPPWRWRVWPEAKPATPAALTPAAAILAAAAAIATDAPTDPPAPTLAPGRELLPCPFCGEVPTLFQETSGSKWGAVVCCITGPEVRTGYQGVEFWRDEAIAAWNRRLLPTPPADDTAPADDGRTYHDPAAEASARAFEAAVDAFAVAYGEHTNDDPGSDVRSIAARAHVLALHAAAVARAEAAERALQTIALQVADYSDDLDDFYDRVSAVVAHLWPLPEAADAAPALVNGGPPTDALDDGR